MPKTYGNIKVEFLWSQSKYWHSPRTLTLLQKLKTCLSQHDNAFMVKDNTHSNR